MFENGVYGLSAEVFSFNSLKEAFESSKSDWDNEHVTPYIRNNFIVNNINIHEPYNRPELRATIDTLEDYIRMESFYLFCDEYKYIQNMDNYIFYQDNVKEVEFKLAT